MIDIPSGMDYNDAKVAMKILWNAEQTYRSVLHDYTNYEKRTTTTRIVEDEQDADEDQNRDELPSFSCRKRLRRNEEGDSNGRRRVDNDNDTDNRKGRRWGRITQLHVSGIASIYLPSWEISYSDVIQLTHLTHLKLDGCDSVPIELFLGSSSSGKNGKNKNCLPCLTHLTLINCQDLISTDVNTAATHYSSSSSAIQHLDIRGGGLWTYDFMSLLMLTILPNLSSSLISLHLAHTPYGSYSVNINTSASTSTSLLSSSISSSSSYNASPTSSSIANQRRRTATNNSSRTSSLFSQQERSRRQRHSQDQEMGQLLVDGLRLLATLYPPTTSTSSSSPCRLEKLKLSFFDSFRNEDVATLFVDIIPLFANLTTLQLPYHKLSDLQLASSLMNDINNKKNNNSNNGGGRSTTIASPTTSNSFIQQTTEMILSSSSSSSSSNTTPTTIIMPQLKRSYCLSWMRMENNKSRNRKSNKISTPSKTTTSNSTTRNTAYSLSSVSRLRNLYLRPTVLVVPQKANHRDNNKNNNNQKNRTEKEILWSLLQYFPELSCVTSTQQRQQQLLQQQQQRTLVSDTTIRTATPSSSSSSSSSSRTIATTSTSACCINNNHTSHHPSRSWKKKNKKNNCQKKRTNLYYSPCPCPCCSNNNTNINTNSRNRYANNKLEIQIEYLIRMNHSGRCLLEGLDEKIREEKDVDDTNDDDDDEERHPQRHNHTHTRTSCHPSIWPLVLERAWKNQPTNFCSSSLSSLSIAATSSDRNNDYIDTASSTTITTTPNTTAPPIPTTNPTPTPWHDIRNATSIYIILQQISHTVLSTTHIPK